MILHRDVHPLITSATNSGYWKYKGRWISVIFPQKSRWQTLRLWCHLFLQHYWKFLYKVRFHDNLKPKNRTPSCTRLRHPFESFLSTGFLEDFFPMTELKHDLTGDLRGGTSNSWGFLKAFEFLSHLFRFAWNICLMFILLFWVAHFTEGRFWLMLRLAESKMYWWLPPSFKETHIPDEVSWIASWHQNRLGVGNKSAPCVFPKPCQVKKHLDDMVEKEKKEASDEGHEAPQRQPPVLHPVENGNPQRWNPSKNGPGTLSRSWWKRTLASWLPQRPLWSLGLRGWGWVVLAEGSC